MQDMQGHIAEFTTDQLGSRYIQQHILEAPSAEDVDRIFEEVCPVVLQLSTDVFANFCIQRLMEKATVQQVDALVQGLQGSILRLSLQTYGCRVIQKVCRSHFLLLACMILNPPSRLSRSSRRILSS